jgi:hypothetical protein
MVRDGWIFIPENRRWDADEREWISKSTRLHSILPSIWADDISDRWWKTLARAYAWRKDLNFALGEAGEPASDVAAPKPWNLAYSARPAR